jgi:hypothetical protein
MVERIGGEEQARTSGAISSARHPHGDHVGMFYSGEQQAEKGLGALCTVTGVGGEVVWGEE